MENRIEYSIEYSICMLDNILNSDINKVMLVKLQSPNMIYNENTKSNSITNEITIQTIKPELHNLYHSMPFPKTNLFHSSGHPPCSQSPRYPR